MKKVFGRWGKHNEGQKEDEVKAITIGAPQGMIHEGHLGFSKEGNFEMRNLPPAWANLFEGLNKTLKDMGVKGLTKAEAQLLLRHAARDAPTLTGDFQIPPPQTTSDPSLNRSLVQPVQLIGAPTNFKVVKHIGSENTTQFNDSLAVPHKSGSAHKKGGSEKKKKAANERIKQIKHLEEENARLLKDKQKAEQSYKDTKDKLGELTKLMFHVEDEKRDLQIEVSQLTVKVQALTDIIERNVTTPQEDIRVQSQNVIATNEQQIQKIKDLMVKEVNEWKEKYKKMEVENYQLNHEMDELSIVLQALQNEKQRILASKAEEEEAAIRNALLQNNHYVESTPAAEETTKIESIPPPPEAEFSAPPPPDSGPPTPPPISTAKKHRHHHKKEKTEQPKIHSTEVPAEGRDALLAAISKPGILKHVETKTKGDKSEMKGLDEDNPLAAIAKALIARRAAIEDTNEDDGELWEESQGWD